MGKKSSEKYLQEWKQRQDLAEKMIPLIGQIYRENGITIRIFGRRLMHHSTIDILKAHKFARQMVGEELDISKSYAMLEAVSRMDLASARIDLGKLCYKHIHADGNQSVKDFLDSELSSINTGKSSILEEPQDVVLYGFGRIGRLLARMLIERIGSGNKMRLRAVVVRGGRDGDLRKRASLLRRDSVHGPFNGSIRIDEEHNAIIANGNYIQFIYANSPADVDYTK